MRGSNNQLRPATTSASRAVPLEIHLRLSPRFVGEGNGNTERSSLPPQAAALSALMDALVYLRPAQVGGRVDRQMSGMDGGVSQPPLAPPSLLRL